MNLIIATFTALFPVVNPLGAMPMFVALTRNSDLAHRQQMARKAAFFMAAILVIFFLAGSYIINFFGISLEGLRIAGGLIIIKSGYDLLNAKYEESKTVSKKVQREALDKQDISMSPLAMPMLSGPGSIALLIGMRSETDGWLDYLFIVLAILLVAVVTWIILKFAPKWVEKLGTSGINAISRMVGFLVLAIGIQYIVNGVTPLVERVFAQA